MSSSVASKQFSDNTFSSLGDPSYRKQIAGEGVERCFHVNGNGFITTGATQGGNISAQTSTTGATWVALSAQPAFKAILSNQSGTTIEVRQGGAGVGFPVPTGQIYEFEGISDTSDLAIRRVDQSNTQVTVAFRWAL